MSSCLPVAAIVLAAGAATRMGRLKQLIPYGGKTFLKHSIAQAREAGFGPIVVVVGAEAPSVQASIATEPVLIVVNPQWQAGMGSSVSAGIGLVRGEASDVAAVAILLGDQPLVKASHLREMRSLLGRNGTAVVAAQYSGTLGVPALFGRSLFPTLAALPPSAGARRLFSDPGIPVASFPLPEAAVDIDTPEDLAALEASA